MGDYNRHVATTSSQHCSDVHGRFLTSQQPEHGCWHRLHVNLQGKKRKETLSSVVARKRDDLHNEPFVEVVTTNALIKVLCLKLFEQILIGAYLQWFKTFGAANKLILKGILHTSSNARLIIHFHEVRSTFTLTITIHKWSSCCSSHCSHASILYT